MILIADSGSTKCDWVMVNDELKAFATANTMGFNPYFHSESFIATVIKQNHDLMAVSEDITHIFYYGAGCSSKSMNEIVKRGLQQHFTQAKIVVDHDLLGAAYSLYRGEPVICGILGTGSNSCYFDGKNLREEVPALGYVLGDEGSGSYFGKKLLAAYMYKHLPTEIYDAFEKKYNPKMRDIVDNVYIKPHANVYLAGYVRFISEHAGHPYMKKLLVDGMTDFLKIHVLPFPEHRSSKVSFVGSVAFYFQEALYEAAARLDLHIGDVIKRPIDRLVQYHIDYLLNSTSVEL